MVILQVLTSDTTATDAYLLNWLQARWRIENTVRCASQHHGIDTLVDDLMDIAPDDRKVTNPVRRCISAENRNCAARRSRTWARDRELPVSGPGPDITGARKCARHALGGVGD